MPIRSKNVSDNNSYNEFAQIVVTVPVVDFGVAASSASMGAFRAPWAGTILSAAQKAGQTSGSTTIAIAKNGTAISDVATVSTTASTFTLTSTSFSAGDYIGIIQDNGNVSTVRANGLVSIVIRPWLGVPERLAASLGDA